MNLQQATDDCQVILGLPDLEVDVWYEHPDGTSRRYIYEISVSGLCRIGNHPRSVVAYTSFIGWKKLAVDYGVQKARAAASGFIWKDKSE